MSDSKPNIEFSPTIFNDPVAEQTEWKRLINGGANFRTHRLVLQSNNTIHFKLSIQFLIIAFFVVSIFIIPSFIMLLAGPMQILLVAPLLLLAVWFLYYVLKPIVFDLERSVFYRGWLKKNEPHEIQDIPSCNLDEIYALQIISEYTYHSVGNFTCYEMNIIKKDASRINVLAHSNGKTIRKGTEVLGQKLGVPVWDATL